MSIDLAGVNQPSEHLLSEPAIVCRLAQATWPTSEQRGGQLPWEDYASDYSLIRAEIEAVIPGFKGENESYERRSEKGFVLPNSARDRQWNVLGGNKARFTWQDIPIDPRQGDQLLMMTLRSHDQYNTTIYGWDDRYRGIYGGRQIIMMNPEDISERGLNDGDKVNIKSYFEGEEREVRGFK